MIPVIIIAFADKILRAAGALCYIVRAISNKVMTKLSARPFDSNEYAVVVSWTIPLCSSQLWRKSHIYSPQPSDCTHFTKFRSRHERVSIFRLSKLSINWIISFSSFFVSFISARKHTIDYLLYKSNLVTEYFLLPSNNVFIGPTASM